MTMLDEFTAEEWANRPEKLRDVTPHHECENEKICRVFKCRGTPGLPFSSVACRRYVGACVGGSEDDRCADCHQRYFEALKRRILWLIRTSKWRGEISLCRMFGKDDRHIPTEDALYELVRAEKIEWFGGGSQNDRPLRYRTRRARRARRR